MKRIITVFTAIVALFVISCQPEQTPESALNAFIHHVKIQDYQEAYKMLTEKAQNNMDTLSFRNLFDYNAEFSESDFKEMPKEYIDFIQTVNDSMQISFEPIKIATDSCNFILTMERFDFKKIAETSMEEMLNSFMAGMEFVFMPEEEQNKVMGQTLIEYIEKNPKLPTYKKQFNYSVLKTDTGYKIEF
jgi:hypothetical protein